VWLARTLGVDTTSSLTTVRVRPFHLKKFFAYCISEIK
jgi:hypothetical protein